VKPGESGIFVTIEGECFRVEYQESVRAQNTDGIYHQFHLDDLSAGRGKILAELALYGPTSLANRNSEVDLDDVCVNAIRNRLDQGSLRFGQQTVPADRYQTFDLTDDDFTGRTSPVSSPLLHQYLIHKAYWIGYKTSSDPSRYWVFFDQPIDRHYLGASLEDIRRAIWFLQGRGYIQMRAGFPGIGRPTHQLVELYESKAVSELPKERVFPKGTEYDSFRAISKILESAISELTIVDNYVDESVLDMILAVPEQVGIKILTHDPKTNFELALRKFRTQYPRKIDVRKHSGEIHDRALMVDDREFFALGTSIRDAGRKLWILNKLEDPSEINVLRTKIQEYWDTSSPL
jgi:predicted RNA-binding protein with RPS1 domain